MGIDKVLRWFAIAICGYLLAVCLLFLASSAVFSYLIARPERVKTILEDSGTYQKIPAILYENIEKENQQEQSDVDLSDPQIKQAALDSFNPSFFQQSFESSIDGIYAWLEGETSQPEFTIDATAAKNNFVKKVVAAEAAEAEKLPACTLQELRQMDPRSVDIFNLKCLPAGVSIDQAAKQAESELKKNQELLGDAKLNAQELENASGEPIFNDNSDLPAKFQLAKKAPLFLAVLSLILTAGVYLASADKKKALNRLAKVLIGAGLVTLLAPFFIKFTSGKLLPAAAGGDPMVSEIITSIIVEFNSAAAAIYYAIGGAMLGLGALLLIAVYKNIFKYKRAEK